MSKPNRQSGQKGNWARFFAMIATATAVMYLLMFQLVYEADHLFFSMNRLVASLVSGAVMVVIMLGFMWQMYGPQRIKWMVLGAAAIAAVALLFVNRQELLVEDRNFMKSMIPHHSIAINNARRADISDPRVRKLADEIIEAQVKEIAEMKLLLEDIEQNGEMGDGEALPPRSADLTPELFEKARESIERPLTPETREQVDIGS